MKRDYDSVYQQLAALLEGETDPVVRMAEMAAVLHERFDFWWTGFYRVTPRPEGGTELLLGPFQGPVACIHIPYAKGVCGTAWARHKTIVVPDVEQFPGHIACSAASRSEIVVPIFNEIGAVTAVLDIDSLELAAFSDDDVPGLEKIVSLL